MIKYIYHLFPMWIWEIAILVMMVLSFVISSLICFEIACLLERGEKKNEI